SLRSFVVRLNKLEERNVPARGVLDAGRDRGGAVSRAKHTRHATRVTSRLLETLGGCPRQPGALPAPLLSQTLHLVVRERDSVRAEGVRLNNVRAGLEVRLVHLLD